MQAFGFDINCATNQDRHYRLSRDGFPSILPNATVFQSSISVRGDSRWFLNVTVMRKTTLACEGQLETQTCTLAPASVSYDLLLNGGNITFRSGSWRDDTVVKPLYVVSSSLGRRFQRRNELTQSLLIATSPPLSHHPLLPSQLFSFLAPASTRRPRL